VKSVPFGSWLVPLPIIVLLPPVSTVPVKPSALPLPVITTLAMRTWVLVPVAIPVPLAVIALSLTAISVALVPCVALMPAFVHDEKKLLAIWPREPLPALTQFEVALAILTLSRVI